MARPDNRRSRVVALARIVLPLAALLLFATIFLFARQIDPNRAIPGAEFDVEAAAREARIGAPSFAGMTEDGAVVTFSAQVARPDPDNAGRMTATGIALTVEAPDAAPSSARADTGIFDSPTGDLVLEGAVEVRAPGGWVLHSDRIETSTVETRLASPGPVVATGPAGRIEAGSLSLAPDDQDVVFTGGVRLLYDPKAGVP